MILIAVNASGHEMCTSENLPMIEKESRYRNSNAAFGTILEELVFQMMQTGNIKTIGPCTESTEITLLAVKKIFFRGPNPF